MLHRARRIRRHRHRLRLHESLVRAACWATGRFLPRALVLGSMALGACAPYRPAVAPELVAWRTDVVREGDGSIALAGWRLVSYEPPHVVTRAHPGSLLLRLREVHSTLTLRAPSGETVAGDCRYTGSSGHLYSAAQGTAECGFRVVGRHGEKRWSVFLHGRGARGYFASARVQGHASRGGSTVKVPAPTAGESTERYTHDLEVEGGPRLLNFYRRRTVFRWYDGTRMSAGPLAPGALAVRGPGALWTSSCCERLEPLGAIALEPEPALYLAKPVAEAELVNLMALTAATVLSQRGITALPETND